MMISTQMPSQSFANNHPGAKPDSCQPSDRGMKCLAKALYDNVAEAPDELAFRKGDVLTVLEQNTNGLEGWWLCTLRGRQGIAPGNRLRLMPGVYDPAEPSGVLSTDRGAIHSRRRSWQVSPNKVITPQKIGDVYVYDVPVGAMIIDAHEKSSFSNLPCRGCSSSCSYDTPPSPRLVGSHPAYDEPRPSSQQYDLPKPYLAYDQPRSHFSQQHNHSQLQSFRAPSKIVRPNDYDIPNADFEAYDIPGPPRAVDKRHLSENLISTMTTNYDIPPTNHIGGCTGSSCSSALPSSQRSSGVSLMSSSSESSLNTSLSLSSICGSNRSSLEHQSQDMYDFPNPGEPRPVVPSDLLRHQSCCAAASIAMPSPSAQCLNRNGCPNSPHNSSKPEPACKLYESPPVPRPAQTGALEGGVYDIPPQVSKDVTLSRPDENGTDFIRRFSSSSTDSREFKENFPDIEGKELPLDLDGAMERLVKLHEEVQSAISKLFSYVSATWRKKEDLEVKIPDIKSTCHKLCSVLQEFLSFVYGALANSTHSADKALCHKLGKLVMPLNDPNSTVQTATQALDDKGWEVSCLTRQKETDCPDELDQLVASARVLVEDVRQVASFIQGNCTLIFKRSQTLMERNFLSASTDYETFDPSDTGTCKNIQETPLPDVPYKSEENETTSKEHSSDYDYVNLESKESVERENEEIKASLPQQLHKSFDNLVKQSYVPVDNDMSKFPVIQPLDGNWSSSLSPSDLQVFKFYTIQFDNHLAFLTNAIDAFLLTIENNQPPKVFIGHSKFVVISAHKLVYIGDTVNRNICSSNLKAKVIQASNGLCDSLKALVSSTKKAALQFPSVVAVQEMIDSVVDVSHLASDLKTVLYDASKL